MSPEFTWTRDFEGGFWVIWHHGRPYAFIERNSKHPAHTRTYVMRVTDMLNRRHP